MASRSARIGLDWGLPFRFTLTSGEGNGEGLREMLVPDWKESRGFRVMTIFPDAAELFGHELSLSSADVHFPSLRPFQPDQKFGIFFEDFLLGQLGA